MPDREKVINGLEWILNDIKEYGNYQVDNYENKIREALVLLKEQEPVKPYKIPHSITHPGGAYVCGDCKIKILEPYDDFCPNCGRAVKWDDSD